MYRGTQELATLRHQKRKEQIINSYLLEKAAVEDWVVEDYVSDEEHLAKVPAKTKGKKHVKTKYLQKFLYASPVEEHKDRVYSPGLSKDLSLNEMIDEFVREDQEKFANYLDVEEINELQEKYECDVEIDMTQIEETPSYNYRNAYKSPAYGSMNTYISRSPVKKKPNIYESPSPKKSLKYFKNSSGKKYGKATSTLASMTKKKVSTKKTKKRDVFYETQTLSK